MSALRKRSAIIVALFALTSLVVPSAMSTDTAYAARPCYSKDTYKTLAYNADCKTVQKYVVLRGSDMGFPSGMSKAAKVGPGGHSGWLPPAPRTLTGHGHWKTLFPR